jgi:hypothetical protein
VPTTISRAVPTAATAAIPPMMSMGRRKKSEDNHYGPRIPRLTPRSMFVGDHPQTPCGSLRWVPLYVFYEIVLQINLPKKNDLERFEQIGDYSNGYSSNNNNIQQQQ